MVKKFKNVLAGVVSRVFDPVWEIPGAILLAVAFAINEGIRWRFLGILLFVDAVVPMIFFLMMLYHKQLANWDMDKRRERLPIYIFMLICHLGGLWLAHELGKTELVAVLLVYYLIGVVFVVVTNWWKISLHAGVNGVLITTIVMFYGSKYLWLYGLLCLVMWARVWQGHHTWAQVIVGAWIGIVVIFCGLSIV